MIYPVDLKSLSNEELLLLRDDAQAELSKRRAYKEMSLTADLQRLHEDLMQALGESR